MAEVLGPWVAFLGAIGLTVGAVALAKGRLAWAKIDNRKNAGLIAGIGLIWLVFGAAITPSATTDDSENERTSRGIGPSPSVAVSKTRLALERTDWSLVDSETLDISGSAEPGANIAVSWSGGSASVVADADGSFRVPVGPISQLGETRANVNASVPGKEQASEFITINRTVSEGKFKSDARSIPYEQLKKDPDALVGTVVTYKGQIFQYDSRTTTASMIVSVTNKGYGIWTDNLYLLLDPSLGANADENDLIQIWGTITGSFSYETASGGTNTLPQVLVKYLTVTAKR
jgi:hypothetical protein